VYYIAENLELRRSEVAGRISAMTGRKVDDCEREVDLAIQRLFYWGAYADKYGGTVQVCGLLGGVVREGLREGRGGGAVQVCGLLGGVVEGG
jgi:aldehyde dehydrogenase (NAD+)